MQRPSSTAWTTSWHATHWPNKNNLEAPSRPALVRRCHIRRLHGRAPQPPLTSSPMFTVLACRTHRPPLQLLPSSRLRQPRPRDPARRGEPTHLDTVCNLEKAQATAPPGERGFTPEEELAPLVAVLYSSPPCPGPTTAKPRPPCSHTPLASAASSPPRIVLLEKSPGIAASPSPRTSGERVVGGGECERKVEGDRGMKDVRGLVLSS